MNAWLFAAFLIYSAPAAWGHVDVYHNFAGTPFWLFSAVIVAALLFYEKHGDSDLGLSVLVSALAAITFIQLFYGNAVFFGTPFLEKLYAAHPFFQAFDYVFVALVAAVPFAFFYLLKPRLDELAALRAA